jgi:hypothetical protein
MFQLHECRSNQQCQANDDVEFKAEINERRDEGGRKEASQLEVSLVVKSLIGIHTVFGSREKRQSAEQPCDKEVKLRLTLLNRVCRLLSSPGAYRIRHKNENCTRINISILFQRKVITIPIPMPSQTRNTIVSQRPIPSCLSSKLRISNPISRADCAAIPPHATTNAVGEFAYLTCHQ